MAMKMRDPFMRMEKKAGRPAMQIDINTPSHGGQRRDRRDPSHSTKLEEKEG